MNTIHLFQAITDEMILEIAQQTNVYSVQKLGTSVNTTPKEIEQVLGMYMHMGLVQMPNVRAFWEMETKYPKVCDVMSRERFLKFLTLGCWCFWRCCLEVDFDPTSRTKSQGFC